MSYTAKQYKKDLEKFKELSLMLKAPKKVQNAKENKEKYDKIRYKHEVLEEKLSKDYDAERKLEKKRLKEAELEEGEEPEDIVDPFLRSQAEINKEAAIKYKNYIKQLELANNIKEDLDEGVIEKEVKIETKPDGSKVVEIKETKEKSDAFMKDPKYSANQYRHVKFHEPKHEREDISDVAKELIGKHTKKKDYKIATIVGRAGGKRKVLKCPHCENVMIATGIKEIPQKKRELSDKTKEWHDYIKRVAKMDEYKDVARPKVMGIASELRKTGFVPPELND